MVPDRANLRDEFAAAGQPPGGPQGTSPMAIASVACGIGVLVLSVVWLGALFIPLWGATGHPAVLFWAEPLGIGACIVAFVLGVVALSRSGARDDAGGPGGGRDGPRLRDDRGADLDGHAARSDPAPHGHTGAEIVLPELA